MLGFHFGSPLLLKIWVTAAALAEAALSFVLILLAGKRTDPPISVKEEYNCSNFNTALIVEVIFFSDLAAAVTGLELTFVDLFLSPDFFALDAILFESESNLDLVALYNLFHSSGE